MKTLDLDECCEFLKIDRNVATRLAQDGTLPGAKIGRAWVFLVDDLTEYLRAETRRQMMERRSKAVIEDGLEAAAARTPSLMSMVSPRAAAKKSRGRVPPDLSAYGVLPELISQVGTTKVGVTA